MVKTVLGVNHQGLTEWMFQRLSAILMLLYFPCIIGYFVLHPHLSYAEWHYLFSQTWIKIITMIVLAAMLYHAWIGVWTIFTDYVKPFVLRCILNTLVLLFLVACLIWGMMILWSV